MDSRLSYSYLPRARTSEERHDRNGNILTLTRLNGTKYAAISMTRTGNRLTAANVSEWDGDDEMEHAIYNYNHNANGAMTFDSMSGISGTVFSWNAAGLLHAFVDDDSSERVEIIWLSDGTKVKTDGDVDSPRYYRGSFVYKDVSISVPTGYDEGDYDTYDFEGLESIAHSEGRFVATDWTTTGVPTLSDRHFVRDLVGSTVAVIDVVSAAASIDLSSLGDALIEQDAYLAYGDRLSASAMTLKTDTGNRYRFNGKERHDWAGYPYIDYGARMYNPLIGSWLSPDPLADKYTSTSPYVFCAGDPVNYVDPDGSFLQKVIAVFFHGGPTGGGKPTTIEKSNDTGLIYQTMISNANNNDINIIGTIIAPGWTSASGVKTGLDFIHANYKEGDQLIIYGYSYGVDVAVDLTHQLQSEDISVKLLVTVDGSDGPLGNRTVNTSIPENVEKNVNYYQTTPSGKSSSIKSSTVSSSGQSSQNNSSVSMSSFYSQSSYSPGSHGGPNKAANPSRTIVNNANVTGENITHGNIQSSIKTKIDQDIKKALQ